MKTNEGRGQGGRADRRRKKGREERGREGRESGRVSKTHAREPLKKFGAVMQVE